MADLKKAEQVRVEAAGARMAEMVAYDVHLVMQGDLGYAELVRRLAVATIAALESEMQVMGVPSGSTDG